MRFTTLAGLAYMATCANSLHIPFLHDDHSSKSASIHIPPFNTEGFRPPLQPFNPLTALAEHDRPSPPLRPTSVSTTTITQGVVPPMAPLRPTTDSVTTITTKPPVERDVSESETNGYYLDCSGSNDTWIYGNVCADNPDFLLPVNKQECDQWCSCDNKGHLKCPSPATGCEDTGRFGQMCASGSPEFTCKCKKLNQKEGQQPSLTRRDPAKTTMYAVIGSALGMEAIVVDEAQTAGINSIFSNLHLAPITPTTILEGHHKPGVATTEPYDGDPFPAAHTTSIYAMGYDDKGKLWAPVVVVPYSDIWSIESQMSEAHFTSKEVVTIPGKRKRAVPAETHATRTQTVGFPPLTERDEAVPSTTMYGVGMAASGIAVVANVVAATNTATVLDAYSKNTISHVTPSTVVNYTTTAFETESAKSATTMYGVIIDPKEGYVIAVAEIPGSRISEVNSVYSSNSVTGVLPKTFTVDNERPPQAGGLGPVATQSTVTTVTYLETVYVTTTTVAGRAPGYTQPDPHHDTMHHQPEFTNGPAAPPSTFSTLTSSKLPSPLEARNEFTFECQGDLGKNIQLPACADPSTQIFLNGYYCRNHCTCTSDGCVTCETNNTPEFIGKCGGNGAATEFCRTLHSGSTLNCGCKNSWNARTGC